jgi:hypothetical protein
MEWSVRVPLLTNRVILRQMVWWAGLTALLCGAIFGGLIVLAVLPMSLFFFSRMILRFRIDVDGIKMATADAKVRAAYTAAMILGALAGRSPKQALLDRYTAMRPAQKA